MTITQVGKGENNRKRIKTSLSVLTYDSSTTIEDKRIYRQKSLRVKWKLKKLYFTWNLLLTVVMLEKVEVQYWNKDLEARSAKQPLCTKYYNTNENASSASGCFSRKKSRLIANQFSPSTKTDLLKKDSKTFHIQNSPVALLD